MSGGGGGGAVTRSSPSSANQIQHSHAGNGSASINRNNKTKRYNSNSVRGTGTAPTTGVSLAPVKPGYLKNKVLVVHGLDKKVTNAILQQEIDRKANKHIELCFVAPLSREKSWCTTIAIELNESDYDILANPDFWEPQIKIRKWFGFRWWRGTKRPTREEVRSSMRQQWI